MTQVHGTSSLYSVYEFVPLIIFGRFVPTSETLERFILTWMVHIRRVQTGTAQDNHTDSQKRDFGTWIRSRFRCLWVEVFEQALGYESLIRASA